ncbi:MULTISPECIES: enoyl-CoA hydratase/isomerase family protein [Brevibacterium]|uniref:Enoyl-CoA hydratase n=1 Tax=Brevibacterium salitolerans TaxID=1403566 RepID=A0ABN2WVE8_9MICO|nr:enoyl-CoA hydratase-related protein [Brevibacterium sp.]
MSSDPASPLVTLSVREHIAVLTLDNGPVNVMSIPLARRLGELVDVCAAEPEIRAVILTAAGERAFCAGSDITEFPELQAPGAAVERKLRVQNEILCTLAELPKPTVAALQGLAYGGGLELALCCDLIVAEEQVSIALPETNLGVFPSSGGTYRTARRSTAARAKELIFLAEPISARTAAEWGLVNRVVPRGEALSTALEMGRRLVTRPPRALALAKRLVDEAHAFSDREMVARSLRASDEAFSSAECAEGTRAFLEHRSPQFHPETALGGPASQSPPQDRTAGGDTPP